MWLQNFDFVCHATFPCCVKKMHTYLSLALFSKYRIHFNVHPRDWNSSVLSWESATRAELCYLFGGTTASARLSDFNLILTNQSLCHFGTFVIADGLYLTSYVGYISLVLFQAFSLPIYERFCDCFGKFV